MRKKIAIEVSKCLDDISSGIKMIGNFKDNKYVVSKVEKIFKESLLKLPIFSIIVSRMIALCTAIFFGCIMHRLKILF